MIALFDRYGESNARGSSATRLIAILLLTIVSGCADSSPPPTLTQSTDVTVDGVFRIRLPAGSRLQPGQGMDSQVGFLEAGRFRLMYDYGLYSDPLLDTSPDTNGQDGQAKDPAAALPQTRHYQAQRLTIDGKTARLVTAYRPDISRTKPWFIGLHIANVKATSMGTLALTLTCSVSDKKDYAEIIGFFQSITLLAR